MQESDKRSSGLSSSDIFVYIKKKTSELMYVLVCEKKKGFCASRTTSFFSSPQRFQIVGKSLRALCTPSRQRKRFYHGNRDKWLGNPQPRSKEEFTQTCYKHLYDCSSQTKRKRGEKTSSQDIVELFWKQKTVLFFEASFWDTKKSTV